MSIDLTSEPGIRPTRAAKLIPSFRDDKPTHPATIVRWILDGVRLSDGSRLKLEAVRLPSGWATTASAVRRFIDGLTADRSGQPTPNAVHGSAAASRSAARADAELVRAGF